MHEVSKTTIHISNNLFIVFNLFDCLALCHKEKNKKRIMNKLSINNWSVKRNPPPANADGGFMLLIKSSSRLVFQFSDDEVAVQAGDVADRDVLRTFSLSSAGVGTVTESEFVHLGQHSFRTA